VPAQQGKELETRIAALYGEPPGKFVAARTALAKTLASEGDRAGAARVRELKRPSLLAWALNALARTRQAAIAELLATGDRMRAAQAAALSGGDAHALRASSQDERRQVAALVHAATAILERAGHAVGPVLERSLSRTLHAATISGRTSPAAVALARGQLTSELELPGDFGGLGLAALAQAEPRNAPEPARGSAAARRQERRNLGAAVRVARRALERAEKAVRESARSARDRRREADRAAVVASRLAERAQAAEAASARAEATRAAAKTTLAELEAELDPTAD
jgi:hypothetical protein